MISSRRKRGFSVPNDTVKSGIFKKNGVQNGVLGGEKMPKNAYFKGFFECRLILCRGTKKVCLSYFNYLLKYGKMMLSIV